MSASRITKIILSVVLAAAAILPLSQAFASDPSSNLIANPGFETSATTPGQPDDWTANSWGSNTASLTYLNNGHSGNYSAETTVSNYVSGDAKWMFTPVSVTSGDQYTYSDWNESTTATNIWAQYEATDGTLSYQWLGGVAASSAWQQTTENFTVPSGVSTVTVFHVLNANGQLTIDDTSLTQDIPCTPTLVNGLANGGFEQTCADSPNVPAGWKTETYGPDPVTYGLTSDVHSGSQAATMTTSSTNDEAGWTTTVASPLANQRYKLSFWQKGNTYVYAYIVETLSDGSTQDVSLMSVPSTAGLYGTVTPTWSQYQDEFDTAANIQSMQVVLATSGEGSVTLDDVALTPLANQTPATFTSGMVSVTLDDNFVDQYTNGVSVLKKDGFAGTFYVTAGTLGTSGYMTDAQLKKTASDGNEIASHLYHLSDMVELDTPTLISEMTGNNFSLLTTLGPQYPVTDFASPYGSYVSSESPTVMQYYQSNRTTDGEMNTKANLDVDQIHARLVEPTTTLADVKSWITQAQTDHSWLVLVYHGITTTPSSDEEAQFAITPTQFKQQMSALKTSGITVKPVNSALQSLLAQE